MLRQLSRLERSRKGLLLGFALLMGLSLVIFYAPGRNGANANPSENRETAAKVGSDKITVADITQLRQSYEQMFGGQFPIAQLGGSRRLLDGLIRDRIVAQEAARLGLQPSDAEVADAITKQFADASGKVDINRYKDQVASQFGGVEKFEQQMRDRLAADKLRAFITAGVTVSDEEVKNDFLRKNTTFNLSYVAVTPDKLASRIQPSDQDLQNYYNAHKADFRILEPQKKIKYVFIDQEKAGQKLNIPDADLRAEYDKLAPENKEAGVKVQEIVLKVARQDLDQSVSQKANQIVQDLRAKATDGKVSEEAFAEAAKGKSEDPKTAKDGGRVDGLVKKSATKPDDPLQRALALGDGEITDPIKYGNAYYIVRRMNAVPKTFEDAKPELLVSLRNRRAYAEAAKLAQRAQDELKQTKDPQKVAQDLAKDANMSPQEMVRETPYVKPGDDVPNIGSSPQFEQAIAPLNNPNDVGERTPVKGGFAIPMLVDKKDPRDPDFSEVKDKVAERVKAEKAQQQLEQTAKELASNAGNAAGLKAAADKLGLKVETADSYKLGTPLGTAGTSPVIDNAVYSLKEGDVTKTPVKASENTYVVIAATKRTDADLAEFARQRADLTEAALSARRSAVYDDYLSSVRARMEREGKIKIYDDVLAKADEGETPAAQPPRPTRGRTSLPVGR